MLRSPSSYEAQSSDEVSFKVNDIIYILAPLDDAAATTTGKVHCRIAQQDCYLSSQLLKSLLISSNVDVDGGEIDHPLHEACKRGNLPFLKELLSVNGISLTGLDHAGNTALYWCCRAGHLDCLKCMFARISEMPSQSFNQLLLRQNILGDNILHGAAWGAHHGIISYLISAIDAALMDKLLSMKNKAGMLPIDLAKSAEVAAILQRAASPSFYNQPQDGANQEDDDSD